MARKVMQRNYDNEGNLISKECSCCRKIKPVSEFNKCKRELDGLQLKCKECLKKYRRENKEHRKAYLKIYNEENKDKIKEKRKKYYQKNSDYIKEKSNKYYQENKEVKKEYQKGYYKNNFDMIKEKKKQYQKDNADRIKEYQKEYKKEYYSKNIQEALQQIKIEVESNPEKYNYIENKEIYGIIYLVHNIESDKYYVGQTTVGFDNRYPKGWLAKHSYKNSVKHDLDIYGEDSFEYIKLFKVAHSQYELDKLEAYYIDYYNAYENGYNENRGYIFTDRGKEK